MGCGRDDGRYDLGNGGAGTRDSWNPAAIMANVGFELLTSTPVWFGGAYVFGWAFLPVRVEASLTDPVTENTFWNDMGSPATLGRR